MIPKRNNGTKGYYEGAELTKLKEFNPTSREPRSGAGPS